MLPQTPPAPRGGEEAGSELSRSAAATAPEISKLHMESMEGHGGVNRHPEIKSNQLGVASWHSREGMSVTNPSYRSIHPAALALLLQGVCLRVKDLQIVCGGETEGELFCWLNNRKMDSK